MAGNGPWDPMDGDIDWNGTGYGTGDPHQGVIDKWFTKVAPYAWAAGMAGPEVIHGLGTLGGAGGAAEAGGAGTSIGGAGVSAAGGAGATSAASTAAGAGMNFGKMFGKLDPTTMILGALSLLGGGDDAQKRQSYTGQMTSPENSLHQALEAASRLGQGLAERKPTRLRGIADAPKPIQIPGLSFQIGGGLGTDPSSAYTGDMFQTGNQTYDPFQSLALRGQSVAEQQKKKEGGV